MAHVTCRCGYSMWNGHTPNNIEFTVFSDRRFCELAENPPALFSDPTEFVLDFDDLMDMADYEVWRCPECGRLYIFDNQNDSNKAKYVYKLEEDQNDTKSI